MTKTSTELILEKQNKSKLSKFEKNNNNEILLLNAPSEDLSILKTIGLDHSLKIVEKEKHSIDAIIGLEQAYGYPVYLGEDIKELCHEYNLKLLRSEQYKGKIDSSLIQKIKEFTEKNPKANIGMENFFILAPAEDFEKTNLKNKNNCTLFYREENHGEARENHKFMKIYSWGENYSFLRRFRWLFNTKQEARNSVDFPFSLGTIIIMFLFLCVNFICYIQNEYFLSLIINSIIFGARILWTTASIFEENLDYLYFWNCKNTKR